MYEPAILDASFDLSRCRGKFLLAGIGGGVPISHTQDTVPPKVPANRGFSRLTLAMFHSDGAYLWAFPHLWKTCPIRLLALQDQIFHDCFLGIRNWYISRVVLSRWSSGYSGTPLQKQLHQLCGQIEHQWLSLVFPLFSPSPLQRPRSLVLLLPSV